MTKKEWADALKLCIGIEAKMDRILADLQEIKTSLGHSEAMLKRRGKIVSTM